MMPIYSNLQKIKFLSTFIFQWNLQFQRNSKEYFGAMCLHSAVGPPSYRYRWEVTAVHNFPYFAKLSGKIDIPSKNRIRIWRADRASLMAYNFGSVEIACVFVLAFMLTIWMWEQWDLTRHFPLRGQAGLFLQLHDFAGSGTVFFIMAELCDFITDLMFFMQL